MANTKEYKIVINGLQESLNAVESLNKQLDNLEQRMNKINSMKSSSSGGGSTASRGNTSALSQEEATQREINKLKQQGEQLDAKIAASQDEIYKRVDATKQLYKEVIADQKSIAANERLVANEYSNTMVGMKAKLADIKAVIQTTDLGDGDKIQRLTKEAGELNAKLLEMEKNYGQFGRQVGHYEIIADGFKGLAIQVGDVTRNFDNAKQALKELKKERDTLSTKKDMGLASPEEVERLKSLIPIVAKLQSSIQDAGKPMDAIMDTMQSIVAIAQAGKGISAFFGLDDDEINKSIQKLVALQNAMQGLQTIQKQLQTQEGIGGWLQKGNAMIDSFVAKLTGAAKAQETLNTANKVGATTTKALTAAQEAQAVATTTATVATKALGVALKALGIGLIISAVAALVEYWDDLSEIVTDTVPALKNVSSWFDRIKAVVVGVGTAIINWMVQPLATLIKTIQAIINGNFSEIPNIIGEGFKKTFNVVENYQKGYNKEIERQQKAHNNKLLKDQKEANDEWIKDEEAKYGKSYQNTKKYLENQMQLITKQLANSKKGSKQYDELVKEQKEVQRKIWENEREYREKSKKELDKRKKESVEAENEIAKAKISAMKEGLNKTITQLEEERKERLNKINRNAKDYKEQEAFWNKHYNDQILKATDDWSKKMQKVYTDLYKNITNYTMENLRRASDTWANMFDKSLRKADDYLGQMNSKASSYNMFGGKLGGQTQTKLEILSLDNSPAVLEIKKYIDEEREILTVISEIQAELNTLDEKRKTLSDEELAYWKEFNEKELKVWKERADNLSKYRDIIKAKYESEYGDGNGGVDWFGQIEKKLYEEGYAENMHDIFNERIAMLQVYYDDVARITKTGVEQEKKIRLAILDETIKEEDAKNLEWYSNSLEDAMNYYNELKDGYEAQLKKGLMSEELYNKKSEEVEKLHQDAIDKIKEEYKNRMYYNEQKATAEEEKINKESYEKNKKLLLTHLNDQLQEVRDFQTAISNLESKQPVINAWGFTNLSETNKNYKQLSEGYTNMVKVLSQMRNRAITILGDKNIPKAMKDTAESVLREVNNMTAGIGDKLEELEHKMSGWFNVGLRMEEINQYFQVLGDSVTQILQSIWDYQDYVFEKEQDELDKLNDELDKKLDEQQDIVEKHKDAIDSIEDELATARGDRRQHLIDQLNAEMAAQREAAAQEKKIQKQKEAAEKKQEQLEKKRREEEYNRNVTQAFISWHLGVANALATQPFMPVGIAMGALATALGAVQYALVKSQKPYAKGGQLEGGVAVGKRHSQGGIPVLGGRASIEGGEFITNRETTMRNVDVLGYINSKKKKLTLDDFIDFYGGKVKKNITAISPKAKFADGGTLPTLSYNYDIDNRLITAIEDYANRPYYVSVVDINSRQAQVKNVQVLAGLTE